MIWNSILDSSMLLWTVPTEYIERIFHTFLGMYLLSHFKYCLSKAKLQRMNKKKQRQFHDDSANGCHANDVIDGIERWKDNTAMCVIFFSIFIFIAARVCT